MKMQLKYKRLFENSKLSIGSEHAAGIDLHAVEQAYLHRSNTLVSKIATGIAIEIPEGYFGLIRDRSSFGSRGIVVCGGVIDSDYRGEILVCLKMIGGVDHSIEKGDKIAQLIILPVPQYELVECEELSETKRGDGGFGSTGR